MKKRPQHLTKEELVSLATSKNVEDRRLVARNFNTPNAILLALLQDSDSSVKSFAKETLQRKQRIKEELSTLRSLKKWFKELREKSDEEDLTQEWEILQNEFWNLEIINKRFERFFERAFGKGSLERYDQIDPCGYYATEFMEMVLSRR